tara:strand:- start:888 stop:1565 length:678 start_codon:yes stop_codon:yes gene_type:complete
VSDKEKILGKVKKCMALAKSSNPNEAAAALRQAQKLMQQHGLTEEDVALSDVSEKHFKAGSAAQPPRWFSMLVSTVSVAFGVHPIYSHHWGKSEVIFIGIDPQSEIAGYVYEVLFRQLKKDRAEHVRKQTRCKPATKTRRGDLFAEAWVYGVRQQVSEFAMPDEHKELTGKYLEVNHPDLGTLKSRTAEARGNDDRSQNAGYKAGKSAYLNKGMGETKRERLVQQ